MRPLASADPPASASAGIHIPYAEFIALMAALMALNALAIDIMLPALQQIGADVGVADPNRRQLVLTAYVIAFGVAQLFYGPLADRFGRRPVLLVGLGIYAIAGVAAAFAETFAALLAMRVVQGIGAASTRVIVVAAIRDLFGGARMASVMSLVMMVFMAVPIIAPSLGQVIVGFTTWHGIFVAIGLLGALMLVWSWFRFGETLAPEKQRALDFRSVVGAFGIVLGNRIALAYTLATALIFGSLFAFLNSSQQIYVGIYGLGAAFPLVFGATAILMSAASFLNSHFVERFGMRRLSHAALLIFVAASVVLAILSELGLATFPAFYVLITIATLAFGFIGTNFNALAMQPLGAVAGTASSVIGFMQTTVSGFLGALIGQAFDGTVTPMMLGYAALGLSALIVVWVGDRGRFLSDV